MPHTPEPWEMTCGYVREVDGCHDLSVFITAGRFIAEVAYNDPEQEANARLIHVAPRMLDTCKLVLKELERAAHGGYSMEAAAMCRLALHHRKGRRYSGGDVE